MKATMTCSNCEAPAPVVRGDYDYSLCGLPVVLENIELIRCRNCGNVDPLIPKMTKIHRLIALAVIRKTDRLTGPEVRYLRKWLGMTAADFAELLKVDKTTVSKWENGALDLGVQTDCLIRMIALGRGEGLSGEIKEAIELFRTISDAIRPVKIRMDTAKMKYEYAA